MQTFHIKKIDDVIKNKTHLEKKLDAKITITGKKVTVESTAVSEYEAELVFDAIAFGFPARKALALQNEEFVFKKIHIRDYTKRKLKDVLARIIGTKGKTRRLIAEISGCEIIVGESEVGIIGQNQDVEHAEQAVIKIIKGSKQSNTYRYLERMNRAKKNQF